jgi:hypothetical protein
MALVILAARGHRRTQVSALFFTLLLLSIPHHEALEANWW